MVNHGLSTAALFILVGMVAERTRTRDIREMGGMQTVTPRLAGAFLVVALASVGLPGLNHFVGEFLVIVGAFAFNHVFAAFAAVGVVLSVIYLLWAYQRMMHGPVPARLQERMVPAMGAVRVSPLRPDLRRWETALLVPLIAAMLFIGVYPKLFLDRINPATSRAITVTAAQSHSARGGP
jgi:NADH-quinone oxidoreductase subunit M